MMIKLRLWLAGKGHELLISLVTGLGFWGLKVFGARGLRVEAWGSCGLKVLKFSCDWV